MKKEKHLKKYIVAIIWYPIYVPVYDDMLVVWAYNKKDVVNLLNEYYNPNMLGTAFDIKICYKMFNTIWCRLFKKVPDKPYIEHL